jgi:hypothetical protein
MGLYERLYEERYAEEREEPAPRTNYPTGLHGKLLREKDEERRGGRPLGLFHGLDSPALERSVDRRGESSGGLYELYKYVRRGPRSLGGAYRFNSLRRRYPQEYAEMKAERMGQGELW